jgi:hypothetical protein
MTVGSTTDKTTWDATSIVFNPFPPMAAATIAAGITPIQRVTILRRNGWILAVARMTELRKAYRDSPI